MTFTLLFQLVFACAQETDIDLLEVPLSVMYAGFELKAGDLLFQDSDCGPFCESIEKVTAGYHGSEFSHVGMLVPSDDGSLVVIEAVSAGVVETALDSFFMRSFDAEGRSKVVVGRIKEEHNHLLAEAMKFAKTKQGIAYDEVFDINNDKYYCSELIYDAFQYANNGKAIFQLQGMTYVDPDTGLLFPIWADYFKKLNVAVPEGQPGLNPGGMSMSPYVDIVHFYGRPEGYKADLHIRP